MIVKRILGWWDSFWFDRQSPASVCLLRICYGLLLLETCWLWSRDLHTWFGPHGVMPLELVRTCSASLVSPKFNLFGMPRFSLFYLLPDTEQTTNLLFCLLIVASIMVTLGLFTRLALVGAFVLLLSFQHRDIFIIAGSDSVMIILGFILVFSPAGKMFSFDRLIDKWRGAGPGDAWQIRDYCWSQRLLQIQMAGLYCQTFWLKVISDVWCNGTAVYYVTRLEEQWRFPVPFLFDHLWTCQLLTYGSMVVEFCLWTLIWVKKFRYYVLLAGVALHLGIDWAMNIPIFEWVMIAFYLCFVDPADIKRMLDYLRSKLVVANKVAESSMPETS